MHASGTQAPDLLAGTARLPVLGLACLSCFFNVSVIDYMGRLYFNALPNFTEGAWSTMIAWLAIGWCAGAIPAGLLARRYGERRVWVAALLGQAFVPAIIAIVPEPWLVPPLGAWGGFTNALMWVGGFSLTQMVPPHRLGLSNAVVLTAAGLGSMLGPLVTRAVLWHEQVAELADSDWLSIGHFLLGESKSDEAPAEDDLSADDGGDGTPATKLESVPGPPLTAFRAMLYALGGASLVTAILVAVAGQRPGRWIGDAARSSARDNRAKLARLLRDARFWALILTLGLTSGPLFQAGNQFLAYRAEDVGLIDGSQDRGWILLYLLRMAVWVGGGLFVGFLAGKKLPGWATAIMLGLFAFGMAAMGAAKLEWHLFLAVGVFDFLRQIMRWANGAYIAEHMHTELRATSIGFGVLLAAVSMAAFGFFTNQFLSPDEEGFDSSYPLFVAAGIGLAGAAALAVFDRFVPIRRREVE